MLRIHKRVNIFFYMLYCILEGEGVAQSLRFVDLVKMLKIGDGQLIWKGLYGFCTYFIGFISLC